MLNDWVWEKVNDKLFILQNNNGETVASLTQENNVWICKLFNNEFNMRFSAILDDVGSCDEAVWKCTLWIYNECNRIADSFHHIRDHLTSLHELYIRTENPPKFAD